MGSIAKGALLAAVLIARPAVAGLELAPRGSAADVVSVSMGAYFGGPFWSWIPYGGFVDREGRLYDFQQSAYVSAGCPGARALEAVGIGTFTVATDCGPMLVSIYMPGPLPIPGLAPGAVITAMGDGLVGTAGQGVHRWVRGAGPGVSPGSYVPDSAGLPSSPSIVVLGHARGHSFAALATGEVYEKGDDAIWRDVSRGLPSGARVTAIGGAREPWLAVENGGLWRRSVGEVWTRDESIPEDVHVWALAAAGDGVLAAAGEEGVMRLTESGWQRETSGLPPSVDVRSLSTVKAGGALWHVFDQLYVGTSDGVFSAAATVQVRTLPAIVNTTGAGGERWRTAVTIGSAAGGVIDLILGGPPLSGVSLGAPYQAAGALSTTDIAAWLSAQGAPMPSDRPAESLSTTYSYPYGTAAADVRLLGRVYSLRPSGGTSGVGLADTSDVDAAEEEASVYGLRASDGGDRSHLAVVALPAVNRPPEPITLSVDVFGADGTKAPGRLEKTLAPGEWFQWNDVLRLAGLADGSSGYACITRTAGTRGWTAYGVVNDARSGDGAVLPPFRPRGRWTARHLLVPVVLDVRGAAGAHYTTELTLVNDSGTPCAATLTFQAAPGYGAPRASKGIAVPLGAAEQRTIPDVIAFLRARGAEIPSSGAGDVAGTLHVVLADSGGRSERSVAALARTTTLDPAAGRFGVSYAAVPFGHGAREGATIWPVPSPVPGRTNIAVVNTGGGSTGSLVLELPADPSAPLFMPPPRVTLAPGEWYQANGANPGAVTRISGDDSFFAYGVTNDGVTSDGTILPMLFVDR